MKSMLTSRSLISGLATILLLALCFVQPSVRARELEPGWSAAAAIESIPTETISFSYDKIVWRYGQSLRLNLTYAMDPTESGQPPSIRALARLKDTAGNTIYVSSANGGVWKTVNGGQTWTFEVNRAQLPLIGDPRTGALSLVPELVIEAPRGAVADLPCSLEITDDVTGKVVYYDGSMATRQQPANEGNIYTVTFQGSLLSAMPGETFCVNLTNPLPLTLANHTLAASDYLINIKGIDGVTFYTRKGSVKPGQTIVVEVNRDQLPDAGDSSTRRLGLAAEITYSLQLMADQLEALRQLPHFPASCDLVDNLTGRISAHATNQTRGKRFIIFVPVPWGTGDR
jgi:hypothetical protein